MAKNMETREISYSRSYGFTIKINNKSAPSQHDYEVVMKRLSRFVKITAYVFEDFKKDGKTSTKLHVHGIFECTRRPYFASVVPKGVKVSTEVLYNIQGWTRYMNKNTFNKETSKIDNQEYLF